MENFKLLCTLIFFWFGAYGYSKIVSFSRFWISVCSFIPPRLCLISRNILQNKVSKKWEGSLSLHLSRSPCGLLWRSNWRFQMWSGGTNQISREKIDSLQHWAKIQNKYKSRIHYCLASVAPSLSKKYKLHRNYINCIQIILGDSKCVIDGWGGKEHFEVLNLADWKIKIEDISKKIMDICFFHIYRKLNPSTKEALWRKGWKHNSKLTHWVHISYNVFHFPLQLQEPFKFSSSPWKLIFFSAYIF